jgi:hypothetical protein
VDSILSFAGVILERTAVATGFLAASIAVGGFLARAQTLLGADDPTDLQGPTAMGGLLGFLFGVLVVIVDAVVG